MPNKTIIIVCFILAYINISAQSQYTNIQISSQYNPIEATICINPKNTNLLIAGANIDLVSGSRNAYYYSLDAGHTWSSGILSSTLGVSLDPCVIIDTSGFDQYFHLSFPQSGGYIIDRIVGQRSTDNGASWSNGTHFGYNPPRNQHVKDWACVDWTNGVRRNYIYVTWTRFDAYNSTSSNDSSHIFFARSSDAGNTWSTPLRINKIGGTSVDGDNAAEGAVPCVGPNGEIYTSWAGPVGPGNAYAIVFDRSTDGGLTWLNDDIYVSDEPGGWLYTVPGVIQVLGCPVTACDISNGPYRGNVYINWTDQRNGATDTDVWFLRSTNGGNNWSTLKRVNDDPPGKHQFFSWMTIDQVTGYIYIMFYDRRNYSDNQNDVYLAYSTDAGNTFINTRLSQSPFTTNGSILLGHYTNITAHNNIIRPIWARNVSNVSTLWTAIVDNLVGIESVSQTIPNKFQLYQNEPNPFNPVTKIRFDVTSPYPLLGKEGMVKLTIYDILGREASVLVNENLKPGTYEVSWDAGNEPSGVYFYKLVTPGYFETRKMILIK